MTGASAAAPLGSTIDSIRQSMPTTSMALWRRISSQPPLTKESRAPALANPTVSRVPSTSTTWACWERTIQARRRRFFVCSRMSGHRWRTSTRLRPPRGPAGCSATGSVDDGAGAGSGAGTEGAGGRGSSAADVGMGRGGGGGGACTSAVEGVGVGAAAAGTSAGDAAGADGVRAGGEGGSAGAAIGAAGRPVDTGTGAPPTTSRRRSSRSMRAITPSEE